MKNLGSAALFACLLLSGCGHFEQKRAVSTQKVYNTSVTNVMDQQLLENIVRLRYLDHPTFLEIASIKQSNDVNMGASLGLNKTMFGSGVDEGKRGTQYSGGGNFGLNAGYKGAADVTFQQMKGRDYVKMFLTPLPWQVVTALVQAGWPLDQVFNLCVERVNNLYNAIDADGPTPKYPPEYKEFYRFSALLSELNDQRLVNFGSNGDMNFSCMYMEIRNADADNAALQQKVNEAKQLAGLDADETMFKLKKNFADLASNKFVIQGRTLLGVMFFLSNGVDVPPSHEEQGLVTITRDKETGAVFDWDKVCRNFRVEWDDQKPADAYVACEYRGKWFYIADDDLETKRTFMLLNVLMSLQSSTYKSTESLLILN